MNLSLFSFWLIISVITLLALSFVVKPLVFPKKELDHPFFAEKPMKEQPHYMTAISLGVLLPIFSIGLYLYWGHSSQVWQWLTTKERAEEVKRAIAELGSREKIIAALRARLDQLPENANSAKGWYILGKLYFNANKIDEAMFALGKAMHLKPDEAEYILQWVSVKFYKYQNKLDDESKILLNKVLKTSPDQVNAINLLAIDAYKQKKYSEALGYWERLLKYYSPDSDDGKSLLQMIHQAQTALVQSEKPLISSPRLIVTLTLSPALKGKIAPTDTLFVYALEENASKIPVAVIRQTLNPLPKTIILDNSQGMLVGRTLEKVSKVYVEARISKTGNAFVTKGDFLGKSSVVELKHKDVPLQVNINEIIPN